MKYKGISAWIIEGVRFGFFDYVMDMIMADSVDEIKKNFAKLKRKTFKYNRGSPLFSWPFWLE